MGLRDANASKKVHKFIASHVFVGLWYDGLMRIRWSSYDKHYRPEYSIWYMQEAILMTYCFCNSWSIHVDSISYSSCGEEQPGQLVHTKLGSHGKNLIYFMGLVKLRSRPSVEVFPVFRMGSKVDQNSSVTGYWWKLFFLCHKIRLLWQK